VLAQPDESHVNRTASLLEWTDTEHTTSDSSEEENFGHFPVY